MIETIIPVRAMSHLNMHVKTRTNQKLKFKSDFILALKV